MSAPSTWDEFLSSPYDPEHRRAEMVDGALSIAEPASVRHQRVLGRLMVEMENWAGAGPGRGSVNLEPPVRIRHDRGYLPDLTWFREEHSRPPAAEPYLPWVPDLVIEVLDERDRPFDVLRRRTDYARAGVQELWMIDSMDLAAVVLRLPPMSGDQAQFIQVDELGPAGVLTSPLMPGLRIPLSVLTPDQPTGVGDRT